MGQNSVRILDTTLRDGEQTPGVSLTPEEKVEIARQLDRLGVDIIEAGFPITSKGEMEAIKDIVKAGLRSEVCGLARCEVKDVDAAIACDLSSLHLFIATSELHMKYKLRLSKEEVLRKAIEAVEYAKKHGLEVEFSAEDATRTEPDFLVQVLRATTEAGASRVDIPDTVGVMTPEKMERLVSDVKAVVKVPIAVHCHDDFGLAVANTVAGIRGGASEAHVTINGLGERAGNASLEEVVMILRNLLGISTGVNTRLIYETSRLVSRLTGVVVQPNKSIVGENAFGHEAGIHTHGVLAFPLTYEPLEPELVGRRRWLQAGKHAGTHGIAAQLQEMGLTPTKDQLKEIVARVKELGDKGKTVTDTDLSAVARLITGRGEEPRIVELVDLAVVTGVKVVPTASVKLVVGGKTYVAAETGVGPVDSAIRAIQKVTDNITSIRLREYRLEAITGGSDALADVIVKVEDGQGRVASGRATGEDVVVASVEAMLQGINRLIPPQPPHPEKKQE